MEKLQGLAETRGLKRTDPPLRIAIRDAEEDGCIGWIERRNHEVGEARIGSDDQLTSGRF